MPDGMTFTQWIAALQAKAAECRAEKEKAEALRVATVDALNAQTAQQDLLALKLSELEAMLL